MMDGPQNKSDAYVSLGPAPARFGMYLDDVDEVLTPILIKERNLESK